MGCNSALFICNDAMHEIDKDPAGWWKKAKDALGRAHPGKTFEFGFGSHANGFRALHQMHADHVALIAVGANYASVLNWHHWGNHGHHTPEDQLELLRLAAAKLGYELHPARPKPFRPFKAATEKEREGWKEEQLRDLREQLRHLEEE